MKQSKFMQFDERNLMLHIRTMYSLFFLLDFRLKRQKVTTLWNLGHSKLVKRNVDAACNKIKVVKIEPFFCFTDKIVFRRTCFSIVIKQKIISLLFMLDMDFKIDRKTG